MSIRVVRTCVGLTGLQMIDLAIAHPHLTSYLRRAGWQRSETGSTADYWRNGRDDAELLVPKFATAPDFDRRVDLLTMDLSRFEQRPPEAIKEDMGRQFVDVTDVQAEHEYGELCIPLDAGHSLFATAKNLVIAAAASALNRRGYFGRSIPKRARDQAKRAFAGHTKPGSYIVPILNAAILPETPWDSEQPRLIETVEEIAFERRVTTTMARALNVLHEIAVTQQREPSRSEIHDAVGEGVSSEMCRAVAAPLKDKNITELDISVAWAPGVTPPRDVPRRIEFPWDCAQRVSDIAVTLKRNPIDSQTVLYGVVVGLRSRSEPGGRVEIETLIEGSKRLVRLDLNAEHYEIARASHKHTPVVVLGTLHRNQGRMATMDVVSFEPDLSLPVVLDD